MSLIKKWSFRRLSLNARMAIVVVTVVAGLIGLTVMNAYESRVRQMAGLETTLRSEIQSAVSIADGFQQRAAKGSWTKC